MLAELQKALVADQKVQVTVWDPQNDSIEYTFASYILEAGGHLLMVAPPPADQVETITPLLQEGLVVGVVLETYPNPYIFYPVIHAKPASPESGFLLKIPANPQIELIHRRRHVRIPMVIPFELEYLVSGRWIAMNARTEDVSGGGLRFTALRLFPKGQELLIQLPINSAQPALCLKARVVFSAENRLKKQPDDLYVTACEFQELEGAQEMMLVRECFRRELGLKH